MVHPRVKVPDLASPWGEGLGMRAIAQVLSDLKWVL
jgi:hypothetical protein